MSEKEPAYASALIDYLDRDAGESKRALSYPITRIELQEFTGTDLKRTRVFVAVGDGAVSKWIEQQ